jgi:hypothetical protein
VFFQPPATRIPSTDRYSILNKTVSVDYALLYAGKA